MAYIDNNLILGGSITISGSGMTIAGQTITGTGTVLSTNVIDLASGGTTPANGTSALQTRDIGEGGDYPLLRVDVTTAFTGATSVEFQIIQHDDTAQSVNVTQVGTTGPIALASLTAGARFVAEINPRLLSKGQRYLSARYLIVGTSTAGAAFVDLGMDIQDGQKFYPSGFSLS